jgi:predicted transcriptional regulator
MTLLTLELKSDLYKRLRHRADRLGKTPQQLAEDLLTRELVESSVEGNQEQRQVTAALQSAGLLTVLTPDEKQQAEAVTATLNEVRTALDRTIGKPLSEAIIEMRGPKE